MHNTSTTTNHFTEVIEPSQTWLFVQLKELWRYRDLIYFLAWRDISVRYKQTFLGALWAIIQPLLSMIVFSIFFGNFANVGSDGVPYPVFNFAALLPWQYFASSMSNSSNSLVSNSALITKVYFPRLSIPLSAILPGLVDFVIAFTILIIMMIMYGITPTWNILWTPFFMLTAMIASLGISLWLSALNVQYRDIRYAIPFLAQFGLFASPVAYSINLLPEQFRVLYGLNPMVGVIEGFRWALIGTETAPGLFTLVSVVTALVLLVTGLLYFNRMEQTFADVI